MSNRADRASGSRRQRAIERHVDALLQACTLPDDIRREARADFLDHLAQDVQEREARGSAADEALAAALREFGDPVEIQRYLEVAGNRGRRRGGTGVSRALRGSRPPVPLRLLLSLRHDVTYALRSLAGAPSLTAVALVTIALGVGANSAIFTILNGVLLRPLPYADAGALVRVWPEKVFSEEMFVEVAERTASYSGLSIVSGVTLTFRPPDGGPRLLRGALATADHMEILGSSPLLGRAIADADQRAGGEPAVVLSHALWQAEFGGDPDIVGRLVDLSGRGLTHRRVAGVMPREHVPLDPRTQFWIPFVVDAEAPGFAGSYGYRVFGRLRLSVTAAQAGAELGRLVPEFTERHPTQFRDVRYSPVDVVPMLETMVAGVRPTLLLLAGAVGFVLLISCSNVANLLLARASSRRTEVAVRLSLGASRGRLVGQLLTESALLGLLGGGLGLLVGVGTIGAISPRIPDYLPRSPDIQLDVNVLAFTAAISLASGVLFGVAPAIRATRINAASMLVDATRSATGGRRRRRLNEALVAVEIALSLVLVIGAALMVKSLTQLRAVDPGFDPTDLAVARLVLTPEYANEADREAYFRDLFGRISASGRVASVGGISYLPLGQGSAGIPYLIEGQDPPEGTSSVVANFREVTPDYFETIGMRLLRGRTLQETDAVESEPVVVINQAMVDLHWPDADPIGKRFVSTVSGEPLFTVVGVVSDIRQHHLAQEPRPEFYLPTAQSGWNFSYLVARIRGDAAAALPDLRAAVSALDPDVVVQELTTMEAVIGESMGDPRFLTGVFSAFAGLAALLGIVGVYGVVSYTTSQRTREIGLRVALGATPDRLVRSVIARSMVPVVTGVVAGLLLAAIVTRFLQALLYDVAPTDPFVFGTVAVVLSLVGVGASFPPARRAAATDPLAALRAD